jgi:uncharacterized protein (TIGR03437 family)
MNRAPAFRLFVGGFFLAALSPLLPAATLSVSVQPNSPQTVTIGQTLTWTATVQDSSSLAPVSGANLPIIDLLGAVQNFTTNASGQVSFVYTVPASVTPGFSAITFGPATKTGFTQSGNVGVSVTVNGLLNLSVTPSGSQTVIPGQSANFTITVTDSNGAGVSGATIPYGGPFNGGSGSFTSGAGGVASTSAGVPLGTASGNYTFSFGAASKSFYVNSPVVQRSVAVTPQLTLLVNNITTIGAGVTRDIPFTVQVGTGLGALPVAGASVTVTNPFPGPNQILTTDATGFGSYAVTARLQDAGARAVIAFSGASAAGYATSSPVNLLVTVLPSLSLTVSPAGLVTAAQGQTMSFLIALIDSNSHAVSGASVPIDDRVVHSITSVTTDGGGHATYTNTISASSTNKAFITFGGVNVAGYFPATAVNVEVEVTGPLLNLTVTPTAIQTVTAGQTVNYTLAVRNGTGAGAIGIAGATVTVTNPFTSANTTVTTDAGGNGLYSLAVPPNQAAATYSVAFSGASAPNFTTSSPASRQVTVNPPPTLTLTVAPAAIQSIGAGQTLNYSLAVQNGSGPGAVGIAGATVTVTNPFTGGGSIVTTGAAGTAGYSLAVPPNQSAGTYTVLFSGASASGFTTSSPTSRQVTVTPVQAPTPVLSVNPSTLSFTVVAGQTSAAQGVVISNTGGGTLQWSAVASADWLAVTPASGTDAGVVNVTANAVPLAAGTYNGSVAILANSSNAPLTIPATLTVTGATGIPTILSHGIVSAAGFKEGTTRGSIAAIFGNSLADADSIASTVPLPRTLRNVTVAVDGVNAPLWYAGPAQINFQVPFEAPLQGHSTVVVTRNGVSSVPIDLPLAPYAPSIFTYQRVAGVIDPVIVHAADQSLVTPANPAVPDEFVVVYGTGIGDLTTLPATGDINPTEPLARANLLAAITIGEAQALVTYGGMTPQTVGLAQFDVQIPRGLPPVSTLPLVIRYNGVASAAVTLYLSTGALP